MNRRLPVTIVGGFLGAGKTSLLHYLISEHRGGHLAILVENPGALNLDGQALRGLCGAMRRQSDTVREIPAGSETAQLEWMAATLRELFLAGRHEHVLIEIGGLSNPAWLGRHFGLVTAPADAFSSWAELHQIVCVVDAIDLFRSTRQASPGSALGIFQNEQITGATLVILNKCDLISDEERLVCRDLIRELNSEARVIETAYGEVPGRIGSGRASAEQLSSRLDMPRTDASADGFESSLASALYRVHRPFHPERFWDWFNADHFGLLRVKGLVWLPTRNLLVGGVSRTRWQNGCGAAGIWWAALPREEWPQEPEALMRMQETWREPYGDRRQELVLIGEADALSGQTRRQLDACLLTDAEYARPVKEWALFPDPFPAWDLEGV
jgi:G3E family GTPase